MPADNDEPIDRRRVRRSPLTMNKKLTFRTVPSVLSRMRRAHLDINDADIQFRGRKLGMEAMGSCIMLDYLDKPESERLAIIRRQAPVFAKLYDDWFDRLSAEEKAAELAANQDKPKGKDKPKP